LSRHFVDLAREIPVLSAVMITTRNAWSTTSGRSDGRYQAVRVGSRPIANSVARSRAGRIIPRELSEVQAAFGHVGLA